MPEWIGWIATSVFAGSYLCRRPVVLRRIQALAALLWIGYGLLIKAPPVVVANVIVFIFALASSLRSAGEPPQSA
jgi:hypothetical protein